MIRALALGLLMGIASPALLAAPEAAEKKGPERAPVMEGIKDLKKLNGKLVSMAEKSGAATVALVSVGGNGSGSGVIVSEDGLILTAAHVLASLKDEVIVIFPDGSRKPAKKLGADFDRDAAMVQLTEAGPYPFVELGKSEGMLVDEWCVALGHPGGFDPTRTPPVRLGRTVHFGKFIVTDCAVVGGDSGGPLFDPDGQVIGIHSNIGMSLMENRHVPIAVFHKQWDALKKGETKGSRFAKKQPQRGPAKPNEKPQDGQSAPDLERPVLGVQLGEPADPTGVAVEGVMEGSPAGKAGLKAGDTIIAVNGKKPKTREELIELVGKLSVGAKLKVVFLRDGKRQKKVMKLVRLGDLAGDAPEPKGEDKPKEEEAKVDEDPEKFFKDLLGDALKNGGQLEMTPELMEQLQKLGGDEGLQKRLQKMLEELGPEALGGLLGGNPLGGREAGPDKFFMSSMEALKPVVAEAAQSTLLVFADDKQVALGTVVSEDGWVLTKDTETKKGEITVEVNKKKIPATLVQRFPKRDLALFQVKNDNLTAIEWASSDDVLPLGSLLTASGPEEDPLGIGVVSVLSRAMAEIGFLGVQMEDAEEGVKIVMTVPDGPAQKAGLKKDDIILELNGKKAGASHEFGTMVRAVKAGEEIELKVRTGDEERKVKVTLVARQSAQRGGPNGPMNGPMSKRLSGFPEVLQHDIPLPPALCGGPLLDLEGLTIGINVSRAGRVKTYAVPVWDVRELLASVDSSKTEAPKKAPDARLNPKEREEVLDVIEDVRKTLEELERRLEKMDRRK